MSKCQILCQNIVNVEYLPCLEMFLPLWTLHVHDVHKMFQLVFFVLFMSHSHCKQDIKSFQENDEKTRPTYSDEEGHLFYHKILRKNFPQVLVDSDPKFSIAYKNTGPDISFDVRTLGTASLPPWMNFVQKSHKTDAYIYGTLQMSDAYQNASSEHELITLEIIALNRESFITESRSLTIEITKHAAKMPHYTLQMVIDDMEIPDFLTEQTISNLVTRVKRVWPESSADLHVVSVLPGEPRFLQVALASQATFPEILRLAPVQVHAAGNWKLCMRKRKQGLPGDEQSPRPEVDVDRQLLPDFLVDWCRLQLLPPAAPRRAPTADSTGLLRARAGRRDLAGMQDSQMHHPQRGSSTKEHLQAREHWPTAVALLLVPLLLAGGVALCWCCRTRLPRRGGAAASARVGPDIQMLNYEEVKSAWNSMRLMSRERDRGFSGGGRLAST